MARRKKSSALDDWIELISTMPWWVGIALAPLLYIVLHGVSMRIASEMLTKPHVTDGIFYALALAGQYLLPLGCLLGAAVSALRRVKRKTLADNVATAKSTDALDGMSWREFELLVGEGFRRRGFQVEELGGAGPDGGVDLVLRKDGEKHLVQCKQWRSFKVGVQVVRELYGVMAAKGAAGGFVVTSGRFTDEAQTFAKGRNIKLVDGDQLLVLMKSVRSPPRNASEGSAERPQPSSRGRAAASLAPSCPKCSGTMVRRTARKGANAGESFWGCGAFPRCRGTA